MLERGLRYLTGRALIAAALIATSAMPALADEPVEEPSSTPSPSVEASPEPSDRPTAQPDPVPAASPSPSVDRRAETQRPPGDGGSAGGERPARRAAEVASVSAVDNEFRPSQLTVTVGTRVVWTNEGQNPHTVTANDRTFDSGTLASGQTLSVTFDEVGPVPYYCQIHGEPGSGMFGVVIVEPAPPGEPAEGDQSPGASPSSDALAGTGIDPIPLLLAALGLAFAGLSALRVGWRATGMEEVMDTRELGHALIDDKGKKK